VATIKLQLVEIVVSAAWDSEYIEASSKNVHFLCQKPSFCDQHWLKDAYDACLL